MRHTERDSADTKITVTHVVDATRAPEVLLGGNVSPKLYGPDGKIVRGRVYVWTEEGLIHGIRR